MATLLYVRTGTNGTDPAFLVDDLGVTIATGAGWTLLSVTSPSDPEGNSGLFTAREIRDSDDLYTAITGGSLEWSKDGATEETAGDYVADYMLLQDFSDDYFNLTDGRLTAPSGTSVPVSGDEGELFWKTDTDELYVHDGTNFVLIADQNGVNNDHGGLDGLADDDHTQYVSLTGNAARNTVTGKVDIGGGELKLPTYTDVPGTLTSGTEGDIAWDSDDDQLYIHDGTSWATFGGVSDHGLLTGLSDDDHPQYGHLAQDETVSGMWTFSPSTSTDPALVVGPDTVAPTTNLTGGAVTYVGDVLYVYDATRTKFLAVSRQHILATKKGVAKNIYLRVGDGIATSETGVRVMANSTITALVAQADASATWTLEVRKNGSATVIASVTVTAATGNQDLTIDVNVDQGDELQFYANVPSGNIKSPVVQVQLAQRI